MKSKFLYLLFISSLSIAQTNFLKGYYIDNKGLRVECYIKNNNWKNNPTLFDIKIELDGPAKNISLNELNEIAIDNEVKFVKSTVDIDISSDNLQYLDSNRQSNFVSKTVLLKVLVEGTNNLYVYEDENISTKMFFNNKTKKEINQLIYKRYLDDSTIKLNEGFKQQLINNLNYGSNYKSSIEKLKYTERDLIECFLKVNISLGDVTIKQVSVNRELKVNYYPIISVNRANLSLDLATGNIPGNYASENKSLFGIGFEIETMLPYKNYQWALYFQPTYISNYSTVISEYRSYFVNPNIDINIKYNYFQVPFGVRRYIFINNVSKLFVNLSYSYTYVFNNSTIEIKGDPKRNLGNPIRGNISFGLGYQFQKFNIEFTKCLPISNETYSDKIRLNYFSIGLKYNISK